MGLPSASRGAGADKSGLPSGSRGMPTDRTFSHCALAGALTHANTSTIRIRRLFISIIAVHIVSRFAQREEHSPDKEGPATRILNLRKKGGNHGSTRGTRK